LTPPRIHTQVVPVDFGDADLAGILYFPRLFHLCHVVMEGFVAEALGITYAVLLKERNLGFPTVRTEADYRSPMPYGHDLRLDMTVRRLGRSSLDFRWRVRLADGEGDERAEVKSTVVCVAMDSFLGVPIPEDIREAFLPFLEADH
jgi:4-hydroxybenzoyl-CoA thioesterase